MNSSAGNEKRDAMANERTRLIQTVEVRPYVRDRYPHHRLRSVCTALLAATVVIGGVVAIALFSFAPLNDGREYDATLLAWHARSETLAFDELQDILLEVPSAEKAREWSQYYTSGPHLAGKNLSQALWTKERWQEFGVESVIVDYDVYLNYPKGHRLALLEKSSDKSKGDSAVAEDWSVKYEAKLEENVLKEDKASQSKDAVPTFHGYSASGNVTAPFVFVNYGTYQDFVDLQAANISLKGKVALAKYGGVFRGLKVKRAQELGMIGIVMYTDPGDDGEVTEKNGNATYPDGPAREPSSVQRGSVQFLSTLGDCHRSAPANANRLCSRRSYNTRLPFQARRTPSSC
jgi:N-acetylated-alpha-linked acidic dipeptidase